MKSPELDVLIDALESRADMTEADFDGVAHALEYLLPEKTPGSFSHLRISTTDGAMLLADDSFPNWSVHIRGRANDRGGNWQCTLREADSRDNDEVIGFGRSPILSQAILAATLRLSMILRDQDAKASSQED